MSKSRGTFIMARTYLDAGLEPDALRYYFACKTSGGVDDLDLNLGDFIARVNSDLVGKFVNLASRCAKLLETHFDNTLGGLSVREQLRSPRAGPTSRRHCLRTSPPRWTACPRCTTRTTSPRSPAMRWRPPTWPTNTSRAPRRGRWPRMPARRDDLHLVLTTALQAFADIAGALKPILPATIGKVEQYLGITLVPGTRSPLEGRTLATPYAPLFTRIDPKHIDAMTEASKDTLARACTRL